MPQTAMPYALSTKPLPYRPWPCDDSDHTIAAGHSLTHYRPGHQKGLPNIVITSRYRILAPFAALAGGAAIGALGPLLGAAGSVGHAAHLTLDAGWSWAALAFCVGLARKSRTESAVMAAVSLVAAVLSYYLTKMGQGEFLTANLNDLSGGTTQTDWQGFLSKTLFWCVAACVLGPPLGLAGNLARGDALQRLPFRVVVPVVAIVETSRRIQVEAPLQETSGTTWSVIRLLAVATVAILIGHAIMTRLPRPTTRQTRK
ncbi:DUF6518 family protein [Streptomyces sp. NPDC058268]|uniref:DUF6518 family protein n=1 Tax=Streptomyces sp. NPDC058268 TaxID=3346413 RepID=UPI0036E47748